jgi:uncharacterized integral membrane protein
MRMVYLLLLLFLLGAIGVFALQNREPVNLTYLGWNVSCPSALLIVIVYLVGMVSGWTVTGLLWRSLRRVSAHSPA